VVVADALGSASLAPAGSASGAAISPSTVAASAARRKIGLTWISPLRQRSDGRSTDPTEVANAGVAKANLVDSSSGGSQRSRQTSFAPVQGY
jgi:hypothetical protein